METWKKNAHFLGRCVRGGAVSGVLGADDGVVLSASDNSLGMRFLVIRS